MIGSNERPESPVSPTTMPPKMACISPIVLRIDQLVSKYIGTAEDDMLCLVDRNQISLTGWTSSIAQRSKLANKKGTKRNQA